MRPVALLGVFALTAWSGDGASAPREPEHRDAVSLEADAREGHAATIPMAWAEALPPIVVHNVNTGAEAAIRLYRDNGSIDPDALDAFALVCGKGDETRAFAPRLAQLVFKSAYDFRARTVLVISVYRPQKPPNGASRHATGEAIDFKLDGVKSPVLAAALRSYPRVGVGIYTHPRTQFVHLDVRDESYHWIDASPPGVTWREKGIPDWTHYRRDAAYTPQSDLPFLIP